MPKHRYMIMRGYMQQNSKLGLEMMHMTTTIQVNLDYQSEDDMREKMRIAAALQPLATALFASSPLRHGKDSGLHNMRAQCWLENDPARTGIPEFIFNDDFCYQDWADYVLNVPVYFLIRDGEYHDMAGKTFKQLMESPNLHEDIGIITIDDFINHASTVFPDLRLKNFIEMRGADCSTPMLCTLPAFWVGLIYNENAQNKTYALIKDWRYGDVIKLRRDVIKNGMNATINGKKFV